MVADRVERDPARYWSIERPARTPRGRSTRTVTAVGETSWLAGLDETWLSNLADGDRQWR